MTISNKDKKLLVYLIAVGLIALVYFFVAKPNMDKQQALVTEIESIKTQVNHYNDIYIHQEEYESRIAEAQVQYSETLNKFFGGLNQENTLMNIKGIEEATNTWISRVSFQEIQTVMGGGTEITADSSTTEPVESDASLPESGLSGLKQDLNIDFSCKYADFKRFIEYMRNYDQRLFVTSISAAYSVDSDLVTGSIVLSQYAITGSDIEYSSPDLSDVQIGVDNIFTTLREPVNDISSEDNTIYEGLEGTGNENQDLDADEENSNDDNSSSNDNSGEIVDNNSEENSDNTNEDEFADDSQNSGRRRRAS